MSNELLEKQSTKNSPEKENKMSSITTIESRNQKKVFSKYKQNNTRSIKGRVGNSKQK